MEPGIEQKSPIYNARKVIQKPVNVVQPVARSASYSDIIKRFTCGQVPPQEPTPVTSSDIYHYPDSVPSFHRVLDHKGVIFQPTTYNAQQAENADCDCCPVQSDRAYRHEESMHISFPKNKICPTPEHKGHLSFAPMHNICQWFPSSHRADPIPSCPLSPHCSCLAQSCPSRAHACSPSYQYAPSPFSSGIQLSNIFDPVFFSREVFVAGDIANLSREDLRATFEVFGRVRVVKSDQKKYGFLFFERECSVQLLANSCTRIGSFLYHMMTMCNTSEGTYGTVAVEVRPWLLSDARYSVHPEQTDKTICQADNNLVFITELPRSLSAMGLVLLIKEQIGGEIISAEIDVDTIYQYPTGNAKVMFESAECQQRALKIGMLHIGQYHERVGLSVYVAKILLPRNYK